MRIAIFSSAENNFSPENREISLAVVHYLRQFNVTLVTGGSSGIPAFMVEKYKGLGGKTVMFSPDKNMREHMKREDNHKSLEFYDEIFYGDGFTDRSIEMIRYVDGAISLNGRTGTLCESLIAIEESLPLVVIDSTGGISEHFSTIMGFTNKQPYGFLGVGSSYGNQIDKLISHIKKQSL